MADAVKIDVAFCCDAQMESGLHAALASALSSNPGRLRLWIVLKGFSPAGSDRVRATIAKVDPCAELHFVDIDLAPYFGFRGLHGNHTAYARLALPSVLPVDRFIYLDSDTLCLADLSELYKVQLGGAFMAMVAHDKKGNHPEMKIYRELGIDENSPYFNSGIMLVDGSEWRRRDITRQCLAFGRRFSPYLVTADQACLNGVGNNDILQLEKKWNLPLYAGTHALQQTPPPAIYHFIGVPKPWDALAFFVHPHFALFYKYLALSSGKPVWLQDQMKLKSYFRLKKFWPAYRKALIERKTPAI
jgi:lipopolysaccharide biosynthesis glycosyltransferase